MALPGAKELVLLAAIAPGIIGFWTILSAWERQKEGALLIVHFDRTNGSLQQNRTFAEEVADDQV
ncbi:MAG: hypothetical protein JHD35_27075 [Sphingopyxis sp.]|nr:hypothetical protein [Sphingopyxis sp.]